MLLCFSVIVPSTVFCNDQCVVKLYKPDPWQSCIFESFAGYAHLTNTKDLLLRQLLLTEITLYKGIKFVEI
jgi:hypothetical protein